MDKSSENIALFDMDGTLCDYNKAMNESLEKLRSPEEPQINWSHNDNPYYIQNRADIIRASESWWENLPKFQLGWDVLEIAKSLEYRIMILTQGPRKNPVSWSGKKKWIEILTYTIFLFALIFRKYAPGSLNGETFLSKVFLATK